MNAGAKEAQGNILLFLHADTFLPQNALTLIKDTINQKTVTGAFDLSFNNSSLAMKIIANTANLRSRFTKLPYGDQAIFIEKTTFNELGGYSKFFLMEDVDLMRRVKKKNLQIKILKEQVITSARKWEEKGVIFTTLRNWVLITLYFFGVHPDKLARFYK